MARQLILKNLMKLAQSIGANPSKFMGTRTNITFLGKGPTKNPLFQRPVPGLEEHITSITLQGQRGAALDKPMISAVEDAMGFATANKLNDIQLKALTINLESLYKGLNPPVLPSASITPIAPGIEGLRRFPKESHKFFGRPLKSKDFAEIDTMVAEGRLPGPGIAGITAGLNQKTGMSRAIARQILQQDTRLNLKPEELFMLREGKGEPLDLMRKYYGRSVFNLDEWLDRAPYANFTSAKEAAAAALKEIELIPAFAEGGLAEVLQAPRKGYWEGLTVKDFIGPVQEQKVISKGVDTSGWGKSRDDLIAESGLDTGGSFLDFLSEKSRIGSNKYNLKLSPSAELNLSKSASQNYQVKNKNIWMQLSSIFNIGPFSADIDYNKYKDKIKVESREDAATVYKDAMDDERLAYRLGYNKDDLDINLRSDKKLKDFYLTLNKVFKRKPKILGKAKGGLARILEV